MVGSWQVNEMNHTCKAKPEHTSQLRKLEHDRTIVPKNMVG